MMTPGPELERLKSNLRAAWMAGDFGVIARYGEAEAEAFVDRLPITPGMQVLDVACGTGNLAIAAARKGALVTGCDIAPNLLDQARTRASVEGLDIQFDEADAEALGYDAATFDLVVSMFGVMFAPRPDVAAAELLRVCRSGGVIALANWTPEGFMGQMSKAVAAHFPPSPTPPAANTWGNEASVRELLGQGVSDIRFTRRLHRFDFPCGEAEAVDLMRRYVGPLHRAFESLDAAEASRLERELEAHWTAHNRATDGTTQVDAEYLEVLATRR
jgi:ubiquinone/menaquinone biosynthesis C-methylase UbiE